ncbi:hypothetical protein GLAREA_04908 [Glarea lozoyensis ATCC 20868]|uniref:Uncharacterized protein n=1 Tax=Glarea lozoyensis (strain ATCC 20868 / MF5171) TaxID=1116229 RepID=S3CNM5_GLAL2|nr:uncharacterized protein GLAREA_04908 [Glarea lozoyensis ATCC 20868]EPE28117.1 hypothetical protein GLAREA_04908 [Glarea lozoyensis ATCC 20868]
MSGLNKTPSSQPQKPGDRQQPVSSRPESPDRFFSPDFLLSSPTIPPSVGFPVSLRPHDCPDLENLAAHRQELNTRVEGSPTSENLSSEDLLDSYDAPRPSPRGMASALQRVEEAEEIETDADNRLRVAYNDIETVGDNVSKSMNSRTLQEEYDRKSKDLNNEIDGSNQTEKVSLVSSGGRDTLTPQA